MKFLWLVASVLTFNGLASAAPFKSMVCKKVISDEIYLTTKANKLNVKWITRGGEDVVQLLRALADKAIPTSLLEAYGHLQIEFTLPVGSCDFTGPGKFSCEHDAGTKGMRVQIAAKVSPYDHDKQPDLYEGKLASVSLGSKFYGKKESRFLKFPMQFEVVSPEHASVAAESDFFFAHYWDYDGFPQDPSCTVENAPLVD